MLKLPPHLLNCVNGAKALFLSTLEFRPSTKVPRSTIISVLRATIAASTREVGVQKNVTAKRLPHFEYKVCFNYTIPCAIIAFATFKKPATFAPFT